MELSSVVHRDPEILGGTPVFVGTRVPLQNLFDYLCAGDTIDEFLHSFPTVSRDQAVAALRQAAELIVSRLTSPDARMPRPQPTQQASHSL
jgi:uncharacterized protein (DUF433 family)